MDELLVEKVLRAAELVPAGRVVSYGDIAGLVGTGPRQVGAVMAAWGSNVPWWRVVNASGRLPAHLLAEARERWAAEGTGARPDGQGCRLAASRADLVRLADDWQDAVADLPRSGTPDAAG